MTMEAAAPSPEIALGQGAVTSQAGYMNPKYSKTVLSQANGIIYVFLISQEIKFFVVYCPLPPV